MLSKTCSPALLLALAAAQACTVTIQTWTFTAEVTEHDGLLTVSLPINAVLDEKASKALGATVRAAVQEALRAAGYTTKSVVWGAKKSPWRLDGYYLHHQFCANKRFCQIRPALAA